MDKITQKINSLFKGVLDPIKVSIFFNYSEFQDFRCLYSKISKYKKSQDITVYALKPLMRLLTQKVDVLTKDLTEELYSESEDYFCFILEWQRQSKKVFIFEIKNRNHLDMGKLQKVFQNNKTELDLIFQLAFEESET